MPSVAKRIELHNTYEKLKDKKRSTSSAVRFSHPLVISAFVLVGSLAVTNIQTTQNITTNAQNILGEESKE